MVDPADNICKACDVSCKPKFCTIPKNSTECTQCASKEEFLLNGVCGAPTLCPNGFN